MSRFSELSEVLQMGSVFRGGLGTMGLGKKLNPVLGRWGEGGGRSQTECKPQCLP